MKHLSRWVFVFAGLVLFPSNGSTQAPYYAGKTITVIEGNKGGIRGRLLRHDYLDSRAAERVKSLSLTNIQSSIAREFIPL